MFRKDESGAIATDWMVVMSALLGLGGAAVLMLSDGAEDLGTDVQKELSEMTVEIPVVPTGLGQNGDVTRLQGIQYASYFGDDPISGTTITEGTANQTIQSMNDNNDQDLLDQFGGLYMTDRASNLQQMTRDIAQDLLEERGIISPWIDAPLYNLSPTALTINDFKHLWDVVEPQVDKGTLRTFLTEADNFHDLHLIYYYQLETTPWKIDVYKALISERGLSA